MGIDFRGKGYVRFVRVGKRTVKDGEACAVWDQHGNHKMIRGPKLVRLYWSTIRFLEHHVAGSEEYLRIRNRDGTIEHIRGPTSLFENPVSHLKVTVEKAIQLPAETTYLVVMRQNGPNTGAKKSGASQPQSGASQAESGDQPPGAVAAETKLVSGPMRFFPEPSDNVHAFKWSDKGAGALAEDMRVLSLRSIIVRTLPCTVRDANDHSATVFVEVRARVAGVNEALAVVDPIKDCDALVKASVLQALAGARFSSTQNSLLEAVQAPLTSNNFTEELSRSLHQQAALEFISLTVGDVKPSEELEKVMRKEDDIASAKVKEQLAAVALDAAMERQEREHKLEAEKKRHQLNVQQDEDKRRVAYLKELKKMDVDLTKYLVATATEATALESPRDQNSAKRGWLHC